LDINNFDETPSNTKLFGAAIIVLSGVLFMAGEKRKATRAERSVPGFE